MSGLVEQLRGQAVTLGRARHFPAETLYHLPSGKQLLAGDVASLADLIDGMLQEHVDVYADIEYDKAACGTCGTVDDYGQTEGVDFPCPSLRMLARHVSSVIGEVTA